MARRVLNRRVTASLGLALLSLSSCRHSDPEAEPRPSASAAASASSYTANARASHFEAELKRARVRWQGKPNVGECAVVLHEKADLELCQAANGALAVLEQEPDAGVEQTLPALESAALALARLSQRVRFLSIGELSQKRVAGDAGAPVPPPAPSAAGPRWVSPLRGPGHHGVFALSDGPISKMMGTTVHLERDLVRNLGAYLEYAELPERRSAFAAVKRLRDQHPQWPLLTALLREAMLLESDADLKRELTEFSASGLPSGPHPSPSHSADSK